MYARLRSVRILSSCPISLFSPLLLLVVREPFTSSFTSSPWADRTARWKRELRWDSLHPLTLLGDCPDGTEVLSGCMVMTADGMLTTASADGTSPRLSRRAIRWGLD